MTRWVSAGIISAVLIVAGCSGPPGDPARAPEKGEKPALSQTLRGSTMKGPAVTGDHKDGAEEEDGHEEGEDGGQDGDRDE